VGLDRDSLRQLTDSALATVGEPPAPFGLYVFPARSPEAELARSIERTVFADFFGNSPELLDTEYGPYEETTYFLCVLDQRRRLPAGMTRLILPSKAGFKSLADIESVWGQSLEAVCARSGVSFDASLIFDVATIAVDAEYRGQATNGLVSLALYQGVVQTAVQLDLRWFVTVLDLVVLDLIQRVTFRPFQQYAGLEPISYLESPASLPVYCDVDEYRPRLRTTDESMHELLFDGSGLEAAVRPLTWTPLLVEQISGDT
jgi:hypothetical protein